MFFLRLSLRVNKRFHNLEYAVNAAPYDIGERSAVPEAADQKCQQQIQQVAPFRNPVSAQRNINIIPEPGG